MQHVQSAKPRGEAVEVEVEVDVTILIATPLRERLEELAEVNDRSLGAEARVAIREHLEREAVHRHLRDPESMRTKP